MKLCLDQACVSAALGNTVTVAFSTGGSAANDSDFPASNLWNNDSPKEGMDLTVKYARFTTFAAAADTIILTYDLVASRTVSKVLISGWIDEDADTFGLGSSTGNIASIAVQYDTGGGWTTAATVSAAAGDYYDVLTTPKIWITFTAQAAADWRIVITPKSSPTGTKAVRVGYVGFYDDLETLPMQEDNTAEILDTRIVTDTIAGMPNIIDRPSYQILQMDGYFLDSGQTQLLDQIFRYTHRPTVTGLSSREKMNPRTLPVLALYADELDDGTTAGAIAANLWGGMVYPMPGFTWTGVRGVGFRPDAQYIFREHV